MKILMLTSALESGGAETHICELAASLARRGNKVTVASSGGKLAEKLSLCEVVHITLPLDSKAPISIAVCIRKLRALIKSEEFDIIHTHSRLASFICRLSIGKRNAPCIVSTVHSHFRVDPILKRLSFWGCSSIAVSEDLRSYLSEEYGICRDNVTLIPNGIDTERFAPRDSSLQSAKEYRGGESPRIVFVSRLDNDCSLGATLLCKTAPRLASQFAGIKIDIIGGGGAYKRILAMSKKVNSDIGYECIRLCGFIKNIQDKLCAYDVFVGVSRAALEAMSSGLPTVLCGNEGFLGILDSSSIEKAAKTNFCCRGSDLPTSDELFGAISSLLQMSGAERALLGSFLRDYVRAHHSLEAVAAMTEDFYRAALLRRPAERGDYVLCGYYGFGNLGDDAMLDAAICRLRGEHPDKKLSVICRDPQKTARRFGVRAIARENPFAISKELSGAEKLIFGGGSILQNASSMRSLRFYTELINYASRRGVSVELLANGLGPIKGNRAKKITARALANCSRLSFRDAASVEFAKELGADAGKIQQEDDLTAALSPCEKSRVESILERIDARGKRMVLVSLRNGTKKKDRRLTESCLFLLSRNGLLPVFVLMHPEKDKKISKRAAKKCGGVFLPSLSPRELAGLVSRAEYAVGNRYHLLYLAKRAGVKVVPIGEDPKLISLL